MATIGTLIYTWLNGELIGTDEFGNRYFKAKNKLIHGRERRWVLYKDQPEASKVPSEWHAWLHHTTSSPLTELAVQRKFWQKSHLENTTGSVKAHRPKGHELHGGIRAQATGDYEAWVPDE